MSSHIRVCDIVKVPLYSQSSWIACELVLFPVTRHADEIAKAGKSFAWNNVNRRRLAGAMGRFSTSYRPEFLLCTH